MILLFSFKIATCLFFYLDISAYVFDCFQLLTSEGHHPLCLFLYIKELAMIFYVRNNNNLNETHLCQLETRHKVMLIKM